MRCALVTGVQTCALPISGEHSHPPRPALRRRLGDGDGSTQRPGEEALCDPCGAEDTAVGIHLVERDALVGEDPHPEAQRAEHPISDEGLVGQAGGRTSNDWWAAEYLKKRKKQRRS